MTHPKIPPSAPPLTSAARRPGANARSKAEQQKKTSHASETSATGETAGFEPAEQTGGGVLSRRARTELLAKYQVNPGAAEAQEKDLRLKRKKEELKKMRPKVFDLLRQHAPNMLPFAIEAEQDDDEQDEGEGEG